MGLELVYRTGDKETCVQLRPSDIDFLSFLRGKGLQKEVEEVFGAGDFGKSFSIERNEVLASLKTLIGKLDSDPDFAPYTYGAKLEIPRGSGKYSSGLGNGISGIPIEGQLYSLWCGFNECILYKLKKDENDKWQRTDPKDVRNTKIIKTDKTFYGGDIFIYKKKAPTALMQSMKQLQSFLEKISVQKVTKMLC